MEHTKILEIGIDSAERLYVVPESKTFLYIYREAMEVHWNSEKSCLCSPKPREWSYFRWYAQIKTAAKEQSCQIAICKETKWVNIPEELKHKIIELEKVIL